MRRESTDPAAVDASDPAALALEWHVRTQSGLLTPDERRALDGWLAADPANLRAFHEVDGLWQDAAGLEADPVSGRLRPRDPRGRDPRASVPDAVAPVRDAPGLPADGPSRRSLLCPALAAAVTLLLAVTAAGLWHGGYGGRLLHDHATATGERVAVQLPDGSALWLGARSAVDVEFDSGARRLVLHHGRVFLRVAPDPRPLTVVAGDASVVALGTAFAVERLRPGGVAVTVAEHAVRLRWHGGDTMRLDAGRRVVVDAAGRAGSVTRVDRRAVAAWRQGRLVAEGQTLGAVVDRLSDHRLMPILIPDRAVAALPVSVVLDLDDPEAALTALAAALPIRVLSAGPLLPAVVSAAD